MMPIKMISMRKSIGRRVVARTAMARAGLDFAFHDAVDGSRLDLDAMVSAGSVGADAAKNRPLKPGEVGAMMSHADLWRQCVDSGSPMIILEDDASPSESARTILDACARHVPDDWGIIHLHSFHKVDGGGDVDSRRTKVFGKGTFSIHRGHTEHGGALAYCINPSGASYLLRNLYPIRFAVDGLTAWMTSGWNTGPAGYVCDPFPFVPGMWRFQNVTDIAGQRPEVPQRYRFLDRDWFHPKSTQWHEFLEPMVGDGSRPMTVMEIGCYEGRSTVWLLENLCQHEDSSLICIDPWEAGGNMPGFSDDIRRGAKERFDHNVAATGLGSRVQLHVAESQDALPLQPNNAFDFIYVDGSHQGHDALFDMVNCFRKLRVGGIMVIDDVKLAGFGVSQAVDAFISCHKESVFAWPIGEGRWAGWQMAIRKKAVGGN